MALVCNYDTFGNQNLIIENRVSLILLKHIIDEVSLKFPFILYRTKETKCRFEFSTKFCVFITLKVQNGLNQNALRCYNNMLWFFGNSGNSHVNYLTESKPEKIPSNKG